MEVVVHDRFVGRNVVHPLTSTCRLATVGLSLSLSSERCASFVVVPGGATGRQVDAPHDGGWSTTVVVVVVRPDARRHVLEIADVGLGVDHHGLSPFLVFGVTQKLGDHSGAMALGEVVTASLELLFRRGDHLLQEILGEGLVVPAVFAVDVQGHIMGGRDQIRWMREILLGHKPTVVFVEQSSAHARHFGIFSDLAAYGRMVASVQACNETFPMAVDVAVVVVFWLLALRHPPGSIAEARARGEVVFAAVVVVAPLYLMVLAFEPPIADQILAKGLA